MKFIGICLALIIIIALEACLSVGSSVALDTELTKITTNVVSVARVEKSATIINIDNYDPDPDNINIILDNMLIKTNIANWSLKVEDINSNNKNGNLLKSSSSSMNYLTIGEGEEKESLSAEEVPFVEGDKRGEIPITISCLQSGSWSLFQYLSDNYEIGINISFSPSV